MKNNFLRIFLKYFFPAILVGGVVFTLILKESKRPESFLPAAKDGQQAQPHSPESLTDNIQKKEIEEPKAGNSQEGSLASREDMIEVEKGKDLQESLVLEQKGEQLLSKLPQSIKHQVPFTTQAPFAKWDAIHEEACEEASLLMIKAYLKKETLTPQKAEEELQKIVAFEIKQTGDYKDSTMKEVVELARKHYGITNLKVLYDFDREELKKQLAKGQPIILPTAGRRLGNPNFKQPGPLYHNLVAIGYDGQNIITNDPGTRKGQDYVYNIDVLFKAIHDFPGKPEEIEKGRKAMIVIE